MEELLLDKKFIQEFTDTVSAVTGLNMVVCSNSFILAASSEMRSERGQALIDGDIFMQSMLSGLNMIVRNPGDDHPCRHCSKASDCVRLGEIAVPVFWESNVLGAIGLVALNKSQKKRLIENETYYLSLAVKFSKMLAIISANEIYQSKLNSLKTHLDGIVGLVSDALIIFDEAGSINYSTHAAQKILEIPKEELESSSVENVFPGMRVDDILYRESFYLEESLNSIDSGFILVKGTPLVSDGNNPVGGIIYLQPVKKNQVIRQHQQEVVRRYSFDYIKGVSRSIMEVKEKARQVARSASTVLIRGESGTGKELFARAIHNESSRAFGPFITVNCAAIPEQLLESELFGYEEGAFTGAQKGGKIGKFELANGGTLFLDEIGDMPISLQSKLLRVLQERCIERIGGGEPIPVDIRLIAATNKDLETMVRKSMFREDLYYRINVIPLYVPPLRERLEDLYLLLEYFIKKHAIIQGKKAKRFSADAINALFNYAWPGNIREVENTVEYIINFEGKNVIELDSLPEHIGTFSMDREGSARFSRVPDYGMDTPREEAVASDKEKKVILALLREHGTSTNSKKRTAEILGMSLATLYRRLKKMRDEGYPV